MKSFLKSFALPVLGLFAAFALEANVYADAFEDANRAFAAGQYAESAHGYEAVLKKDGYSAAVLFDLGNADLRLNKIGDAILNYERAKWLAPHDPDIAANLHFAQKQSGLPVPGESWSDSVADLFSPNDWALLASGALVALCVGILGVQTGGRNRHSFHLLSAVSGVVLLMAGGAVAVRYAQLDLAVLPAKTTPALISPFAGAKTAAEFLAGQKVIVEKTHGDFDFVRDVSGRNGWVSQAQVALLVPSFGSQ